jgi:hypothetical protein
VSDAAPLPRLGEVFFDVRGNSRSMRLSWYADTGVAVFSIWQAGMCTGTFRLPIGDLSRMIEILERGPSPQGRGRPPVSAARRGPQRGREEYPPDEDEIGLLDATGGAGRYAPADYAADYGGPDYGRPDYGRPDYGRPDYGRPDYGSSGHASGQYATAGSDGLSAAAGERGAGDHGSGYGFDDADGGTAAYPAADYGSAGYDNAGYEHGGYEHPRYERPGYERPGYEPADYSASRPDRSEGYGRGYAEDDPAWRGGQASGPDYLSGGYESQPAFPAGDHRRDDGRFPPDPGGMPSVDTDGVGYHEERFVPPYVRGGGDSYRNDNRAGTAGYASELDDSGYERDAPPVSPPDGYHEPPWPGEAYSYGAEYRRR